MSVDAQTESPAPSSRFALVLKVLLGVAGAVALFRMGRTLGGYVPQFSPAPDGDAPDGYAQSSDQERALTVAVLPFMNVGPDVDGAYIAAGLTEELTVNLGHYSALQLASRYATRGYDDRVVDTIDVKDLDSILEQVTAQGGSIVSEKAAIPGIGWFAQIRDPEGNVFGLMRDDPSAK